MALSDLLSFFSSDASEKYHAKPHDPVKARAPLLRGIATARKQFNGDEYKKPNRWFSVKNEVVAFHPKLGGRPLVLNGVEENHMPSDRFLEFLDLMEKEVTKGQFDEVIANHGKGNVNVHIGKARKPRGSGRAASNGGKKYPDDHPATIDPNWSSYTQGEKIKKASAYRKAQTA